ncbi:MAG: hypothetical protein H6813_03560 [Phycisphaeraceae bacterium]|nr:hypothetical protein [Phycisphaeraceae bacterium]MCB9847024.1 hypothetical protein [Phycisphaeraceae bacterium]
MKRRVIGSVAGAVAAVVGLVGCAGYGNYTASGAGPDSGFRALDSPNAPHMSEVIRKAVVSAVQASGIDEPYAVRLPEAMDETRRGRVLAALDDPNARLAGDGDTSGLPEFAVERVIVRVTRAEVDVAVPILGVDWPDGTPARQLTTYYLKSRLGGWDVKRMRSWSIGVNERAIADLQRAQESADAVVNEDESKSSDEPPF